MIIIIFILFSWIRKHVLKIKLFFQLTWTPHQRKEFLNDNIQQHSAVLLQLAAIGLSTQVQTICLSIVKSCVAFLASQNQLPAVHLLQVGLQSSPLHVVLVAELTKHVALGGRLVKHLDLRWISVGGAAIE